MEFSFQTASSNFRQKIQTFDDTFTGMLKKTELSGYRINEGENNRWELELVRYNNDEGVGTNPWWFMYGEIENSSILSQAGIFIHIFFIPDCL